MAIDKESTGVPEVDFKRATTKVNLAIVVGAAVFFIITAWILVVYSRRADDDTNRPSPPLQQSGTSVEPTPTSPPAGKN